MMFNRCIKCIFDFGYFCWIYQIRSSEIDLPFLVMEDERQTWVCSKYLLGNQLQTEQSLQNPVMLPSCFMSFLMKATIVSQSLETERSSLFISRESSQWKM